MVSMLEQSFIFLDRIGPRSERRIWDQDIDDWDSFLKKDTVKGFSKTRKSFYDRRIARAKQALKARDHGFFIKHLPKSEHYRLWDQLKHGPLYLDIETTGYHGDITVIGMYDGEQSVMMVRDRNMDKGRFLKILDRYEVLLTFNGLSFDLPVIQKFFHTKIVKPHIDLRFVCKRIGLSGGLKVIEQLLDIERGKDVSDMMGEDAVYLWQMWKTTGNDKHLEKLLAYNEEDIVNLKPIAEYAIPKLWDTIKNGKAARR